MGQTSDLASIPSREDQLCWLIAYGQRYRANNSVRSGTIATALEAVGTGMANLGTPDPRKPVAGTKPNDPLLVAFLKRLKDEDGPATRTYPANLTILRKLLEALSIDHVEYGCFNAHVIDLCIVGFYWLLRPAEYLHGAAAEDGRSQAFRFHDITLVLDGVTMPGTTAPLNDSEVKRIEHASLRFDDQKNSVRGEIVGHTANNDPFYCPAKALGRIALRLQQDGADEDTPICEHFNRAKNQWYRITPNAITTGLRHAAGLCQEATGIDPWLISARSLRPGGACALMCADVDSDHIALLGRWTSAAMFRYLRIQIATRGLSQRMLDHGAYTFAPGRDPAKDLPDQTPTAIQALLAHLELDD